MKGKKKEKRDIVYLQTKSANISNFNRKSLNRNVNKYKEKEEQEGKKNVFCYDGFRRTCEQYFFYFFADCRRSRRIRLVGWRWRV